MTGPNDLILHQYEVSPFSEKVRVALGIKGLSWRACNQPSIMPKPEMIALTGGYRRIPMLQIGADLWFDSLYIIEELDRRFPQSPAFGRSGVGLASIFGRWSDGELFMTIVGLLFGGDWDFDEAFVKDRSALSGGGFDTARMAEGVPMLTAQLKQHLQLLETQLADGRAFLTGDKPDEIDAAVACQTAFIRWGKGRTAAVVDGFPGICAWERRIAALGHGDRGEDVSREDAIAIAHGSTPAAVAAGSDDDGFAPGDAVGFKYHDANSPVLEGTLLRIDARGLTLRPTASALGEINLHMPHSVGALSKR